MATGRTLKRHGRVYVDGIDLSGDVRQYGPLNWEYEQAKGAALTDEIQGALPNQPTITPTMIQSFLDNTAGHVHTMFSSGAGQMRNVMIPQGIRAAPAAGDPVFAGQFEQASYLQEEGDGFVICSMKFNESARRTAFLTYEQPWGFLLHPKGAETAVNTATGLDDNGASSALGGVMIYQLFSSNGTLQLITQHASTNSNASFSNISGATSGSINASTTPVGGAVEIAKGTTINRFTRWQLSFGTATTATFALAFIRANR